MKTEAAKAAQRRYYAANKEKWAAHHEKRMTEHLEERRSATAAWKKANPERHKAYSDAYNAKFRAENPTYQYEWTKRNPEAARQCARRYRANKYSAFGSHTDAEWAAIVAKQHGRCADCNEKRPLERDHKVPISRGGSDMAVNIEGRCRSCNARKSNSLPPETQLSVFDCVQVA